MHAATALLIDGKLHTRDAPRSPRIEFF